MAQFPEDLIIEILLYLPAKSIQRFRRLSKSLHAVIDSLDFINSHLGKSSRNLNRKLIFQDERNKKFHVFEENIDLEAENLIVLEKPLTSSWNEVYGYCKGLILLTRTPRETGFGLTLWNPSTCHYRDLPDCPVAVLANANVWLHIVGSGLGYDESTDDYKGFFVVLVQRYLEFYDVEVWIYALKSNIWRRAEDFPYLGWRVDQVTSFGGFGYFADGVMHWLILRPCDNGWQKDIAAIDVSKEKYSLVPQPVSSIKSKGTQLHVLEEHLCVSYYLWPYSEIYVRKKDGVDDEFRWTQLYSISVREPPLSSDDWCFAMMTVLGYSKKRDKILLDLNMAYFVSFDLKEKRFEKFEIDKDPNWKAPILCLQSLVSISGGA